jgi:DNA-directed RNA polymerase subunit RPC12/RpoP
MYCPTCHKEVVPNHWKSQPINVCPDCGNVLDFPNEGDAMIQDSKHNGILRTVYLAKCNVCHKEYETFDADLPCPNCGLCDNTVNNTFGIIDVTNAG